MDINYLYKTLTNIPLFQGINGQDLARLEEKVGMDFLHRNQRNPMLAEQDKMCRNLIFVTEGKFIRELESDDPAYVYQELLEAPYVLEPESLFGMNQHYRASYKAYGDCTLLVIDKMDLTQVLMKDGIFRLNLLNWLANNMHKYTDQLKEPAAQDIKGKIGQFIRHISVSQTGKKYLKIKMTTLAQQVCETRLNVSNTLNQMNENGLIELKRMEIYIPELSKLG